MFSILNSDRYEEVIKYSRFISLIYRVYSKDDVDRILMEVKKEYRDASHYCFGYVIDNDMKAFDDGEPSHTAGIPIVNQIVGNDLNYTLIIVVRYFGGVKLGVGPLARAYARVAKMVIKRENIVRLRPGYEVSISFGYNDIKNIDYLIRDYDITLKEFGDKVIYHVLIPKDVLDSFLNYDVKIIRDVYIEKE